MTGSSLGLFYAILIPLIMLCYEYMLCYELLSFEVMFFNFLRHFLILYAGVCTHTNNINLKFVFYN